MILLKTGEGLEIECITPPVPESIKDNIIHLLGHKGWPWVDDIQKRLRSTSGGSDLFFLAKLDGKYVGNLWLCDKNGIGVIGHVFVSPQHRRKGLSSRLLQSALASFSSRNGKCLYLTTESSIAYKMYNKLGFKNIAGDITRGEACVMRNIIDKSFDEKEYFQETCNLKVRQMDRTDLPACFILYNAANDVKVKDYVQGICTGQEIEEAFITGMVKQDRKEVLFSVIDNGKTLIGVCSLIIKKKPAYESHCGIIDYYIYPNFKKNGREMVKNTLSLAEKLCVEIVDAYCIDETKICFFKSLGFKECATLPRRFKIDNNFLNCQFMELSMDKRKS